MDKRFKRMNVIFDFQVFVQQYYGGISRYFIELAKAINKGKLCKAKIITPWYINNYLSEPENKDVVISLRNERIIKNKLYDLSDTINSLFTEWYLKYRNIDILHETYYTEKPIKNNNVKRVITVHDMIYELYPENLPNAKKVITAKKSAIDRADCIIAVSENTKNDLINIYPCTKDKVSVIYHGVSLNEKNSMPFFKIEKPYVLFVGNRLGYKNFTSLIDVYNQNNLISNDYLLICFGGGGFNQEELKKIEKSGLKEKVLQFNGNDAMLKSMYQSASLFVYPSIYEGFGMPVLEAMAEGCPVVCSNSSSLPEVAGDAAYYFDSNNIDSMEKAITDVLCNNEIKQGLVNKGYERVKIFTWERCADQTVKTYTQILS